MYSSYRSSSTLSSCARRCYKILDAAFCHVYLKLLSSYHCRLGSWYQDSSCFIFAVFLLTTSFNIFSVQTISSSISVLSCSCQIYIQHPSGVRKPATSHPQQQGFYLPVALLHENPTRPLLYSSDSNPYTQRPIQCGQV